MRALRRASCASFVITYHGKPVESVKTAWKTCLRKANVKRDITPYCLRHLFATEAIANGADVGTVSKIMGHASPEMVLKHYQHVLTRQKKAAVESLPSMPLPSVLYGRVCMDKKNGSASC
ncbi:MAG: tyrosine-type recombinase/integrase [Mailhella sp.]|nr:tyrosine-type recombinase/integrase [Mailhella sp.]